jgi:hypothetical protein
VRRPYLPLSVAAHAVLLALAYYFGSYQLELRQQEAEVASSLRATSEASTAKRLQDLQTIKQLLEKSADRVDSQPEPGAAPLVEPQTPEEMVERARELSKAIDALDEEIRAEELAKLMDVPKPPPAPEPPPAAVQEPPVAETMVANNDAALELQGTQATITQEMAAREVAALEAKARETLTKRQRRLEAQANGVPVEGLESGEGRPGDSDTPAASHGNGRGSGTTVRAEIADFIGAGASIDPKTPSTTYASVNFFGHGSGEIPPVDVTNLVRGRGRMLGAGGEYANRVYLNSWYIIGPFAGRHGAGLFDNPSYPPEQAVLLDAVYYGKDKRLLKWRYVTAQSYPLVPPDSVEDSVYYGYTEVFVDEACDLVAWIGVDDDVQIYLNDRMVWRGGNIDKQWYFDAVFRRGTPYLRDYNRTEGLRVLHFNKGRNKIFFKLSNGPNYPFLSLVLTR